MATPAGMRPPNLKSLARPLDLSVTDRLASAAFRTKTGGCGTGKYNKDEQNDVYRCISALAPSWTAAARSAASRAEAAGSGQTIRSGSPEKSGEMNGPPW